MERRREADTCVLLEQALRDGRGRDDAARGKILRERADGDDTTHSAVGVDDGNL